jgi:hypothetical protein
MSFYDRDPTVPYRSNVDVDSLFAAHAHRPERAQAWLRFPEVPENIEAVMMAGISKVEFSEATLTIGRSRRHIPVDWPLAHQRSAL